MKLSKYRKEELMERLKRKCTLKNLGLLIFIMLLYLVGCSTGPGAHTYTDEVAKAVASGTSGISGSIIISAIIICIFVD